MTRGSVPIIIEPVAIEDDPLCQAALLVEQDAALNGNGGIGCLVR
jgi:hypothetical protein